MSSTPITTSRTRAPCAGRARERRRRWRLEVLVVAAVQGRRPVDPDVLGVLAGRLGLVPGPGVGRLVQVFAGGQRLGVGRAAPAAGPAAAAAGGLEVAPRVDDEVVALRAGQPDRRVAEPVGALGRCASSGRRLRAGQPVAVAEVGPVDRAVRVDRGRVEARDDRLPGPLLLGVGQPVRGLVVPGRRHRPRPERGLRVDDDPGLPALGPVDEEPVGRRRGQRHRAGVRLDVGGGLQVGRRRRPPAARPAGARRPAGRRRAAATNGPRPARCPAVPAGRRPSCQPAAGAEVWARMNSRLPAKIAGASLSSVATW